VTKKQPTIMKNDMIHLGAMSQELARQEIGATTEGGGGATVTGSGCGDGENWEVQWWREHARKLTEQAYIALKYISIGSSSEQLLKPYYQ
jgi:hypothetical protein